MRAMLPAFILSMVLAGGCEVPEDVSSEVLVTSDGGPDMARKRPAENPFRCNPYLPGTPCLQEETCCFCCTDHNGLRNCRLHYGCD